MLKRPVDVVQRLTVGDELVDHQLAAEVVVHQAWQLAAALDAAECAALPHTSGDQLECYVC